MSFLVKISDNTRHHQRIVVHINNGLLQGVLRMMKPSARNLALSLRMADLSSPVKVFEKFLPAFIFKSKPGIKIIVNRHLKDIHHAKFYFMQCFPVGAPENFLSHDIG